MPAFRFLLGSLAFTFTLPLALPVPANAQRAASIEEAALFEREPSVAASGATYRVRFAALRQRLEHAPLELLPDAQDGIAPRPGFPVDALPIDLPLPDGRLVPFRVVASPLFAPDLERQWPELRTYRAVGAHDPALSARIDVSPFGVHAVVFTEAGTALVNPDPLGSDSPDRVIASWTKDVEDAPFLCESDDLEPGFEKRGGTTDPEGGGRPAGTAIGGGPLRVFRLILMATGEYTIRCGGHLRALSQIATSMNRVQAIFDREGPVRFQIVGVRVFEDPLDDPYPSNTANQLLLRNPSVVDGYFLGLPWDLTQVLSVTTYYEGRAFRPTNCYEGYKGISAVTGPDPYSATFSLKVMPHEIGHMLGATHSQDGGTNRTAESPFEPGTGWTLMSSPGDSRSYADPYFHVASLAQIDTTLSRPSGCESRFDLGNKPPIVDAGPDYTIPRGTPFELSGSALDEDRDAVLTYTWEQVDRAATAGNLAEGPLFRSRPPTASASRAFPALATVLSGVADPLERMPTVDRVLRFRLTARDNQPGIGGGGHGSDEMTVTVSGAPFSVGFPNGGNTIAAGIPVAVQWTVGGGTVAGQVDILMSSDGGATWHSVVAGTPNDGAETIAFDPRWIGPRCRIRVNASGSIFYDVSDADFTLLPAGGAAGDASADSPGPAPSSAIADRTAGPAAIEAVSPSPARGPLRVDFALPVPGRARLSVVDVRGRTVAVLLDGVRAAGRHQTTWSGEGAAGRAPGLYFVRLEFGGTTDVRKAIVRP
ncbi:MAG: zinc-dependent metalloprotease family protein [Candidatus Eiseniibacteriota bacterium]